MDGSSEDEPGVGREAGYGIASGTGVKIAEFVPNHLLQTNNSAELYAAVQSLKLFSDDHIAGCTVSL